MQELFLVMLRLVYELLLVGLLWAHWISRGGADRLLVKALGSVQPRQRHPQSPRDCQVCGAARGTGEGQAKRVVGPWAVQKSKRGRPKVVETDGHSCPNPRCPYDQITGRRVQALMGDGLHYGTDTIQYLRGQACHTKVSVRRDTPCMT